MQTWRMGIKKNEDLRTIIKITEREEGLLRTLLDVATDKIDDTLDQKEDLFEKAQAKKLRQALGFGYGLLERIS